MRKFFLLIALAVSACAAPSDGPKDISPAKAATLLEGKVQLLDVRTEEEWNAGHLEGATRVEIGGKDFAEKVQAGFDKSKPVVVYCRSGRRSSKAADKLDAMGFETVYNLKGGILAWTEDGRKVVR